MTDLEDRRNRVGKCKHFVFVVSWGGFSFFCYVVSCCSRLSYLALSLVLIFTMVTQIEHWMGSLAMCFCSSGVIFFFFCIVVALSPVARNNTREKVSAPPDFSSSKIVSSQDNPKCHEQQTKHKNNIKTVEPTHESVLSALVTVLGLSHGYSIWVVLPASLSLGW